MQVLRDRPRSPREQLRVDVLRADCCSSTNRSGSNHRGRIKDPTLSEPRADGPCYKSEGHIARMVETFIAADAAGQPLFTDNSKRDGCDRRRKESRCYANQNLRQDLGGFIT